MSCWIGGVKLENLTMNEAVASIVRMVGKTDKPGFVCTANLDHLTCMQHDPDFRTVYRNASLVVADGMPLVWLSRLAGTPLKQRVAGSDLFWELGRASSLVGIRLFYLGGQPGSAEKAARKVDERFPGVQIAGTYCPPFGKLDDPEEDAKICAAIREAKPDVLLVGLGSPKQEKWIAAHLDVLGVPVSIGVGASFDMAGGFVRRAPMWMQQIGCEWLFRLMQEPRRLWVRYVQKDLPYFARLAALTLRLRVRGRRSNESITATNTNQ
jgi:N-acetylglucosaminyldiphosphoundecaprenol N-acetyl-beta-D-mannosaminyltransferase